MDKQQLFRDLLATHQAQIRRTCGGYAADPEEAKDLFQEVCLRVWWGLDTFRQAAAASTWLYRITVNTCLLHVRRQQVSPLRWVADLPDLPDEEAEAPTAQLALLQRCIHQLPEQDRLLLLLYLEDLSYQQIADSLGLTVTNVGVKLNRLKKLLTQKMTIYGRV